MKFLFLLRFKLFDLCRSIFLHHNIVILFNKNPDGDQSRPHHAIVNNNLNGAVSDTIEEAAVMIQLADKKIYKKL